MKQMPEDWREQIELRDAELTLLREQLVEREALIEELSRALEEQARVIEALAVRLGITGN